MMNPRYLAVSLLNKTFRKGSYSNIQLSKGLEASGLSARDKGLCSVIYYGVIERKITLDYIIAGLSSRPLNKLDDTVLNILRCGIYQLSFMDSIPDSAAVNESVSLAGQFGKKSAGGFINAVLRSFIRREKVYPVPCDIFHSSSIMYSAPEWLVESLFSDYGPELMTSLLSDSLDKPPVTIRRNPLKCSEEELLSEKSGIICEPAGDIPDCYILSGGGDPAASYAFKEGWFHVQDKASQLCAMAMAPEKTDRILDVCAAPGGKTFTMAELMGGEGIIFAGDLHEKRAGLIRQGAERLGLTNIRTFAGDASVLNSELPQFNKILCDVPCSGIGAVRRKPEIKYKDPLDFQGLPDIQYKIAENALNYLCIGGELVYSTCTLRKEENDRVTDRLLENHPELEPVSFLEELGGPFGSYKASIFPCHFGSDGFYISKVRKVR